MIILHSLFYKHLTTRGRDLAHGGDDAFRRGANEFGYDIVSVLP